MFITRLITCTIMLGLSASAWAIPNPAAQFCVAVDGQQHVIVSPEGEWALCALDEGSIEAWTLYRYACGLSSGAVQSYRTHPNPKNVDADDPSAAYCAQMGGTSLRRAYRQGGDVAICWFSDNSVIAQKTLWLGPGHPDHARLDAVLDRYAP